MRLLFCGIFAGLFVVLLVLFLILIIKRKFNKYDVFKYLLGVLLPVFIVTGALFPFAYDDLWRDNIPYTLVKDSFEGYIDGNVYNTIEIFKYPVYHQRSTCAPGYHPRYFDVKKRSKFEAYLKTVKTYAGVEEYDDGSKTFLFEYQGEVWTLHNYSYEPQTYEWNHYPLGKRPERKTHFYGNDRYVSIFSYVVNYIEECGEVYKYITFEVEDVEDFENYLETVELYAGRDDGPDGEEYIRFVEGENMWTLTRYKDIEGRYCWASEKTSVADRNNEEE